MRQLQEVQDRNIDAESTSIFRGSPLGECIAVLVSIHYCFTALLWLGNTPKSLFNLSLVATTCWILLRTCGRLRRSKFSPFITLAGLYFLSVSQSSISDNIPIWLTHGPFGPFTCTILMSVFLIADSWNRLASHATELRSLSKKFRNVGNSILSKYWGWGLMSLFVIYMIIIPALDSLAKSSLEPTTISQNLDDLTFADAVRLRTTEAFTAALFFTLGAVIGSFLNVIAYRTPRGESLIRQPSACPNCGSHIASRDNIPVLGWFWLNGKCRCCQKPISSRYPIVEATTGGLFLLFYFAELLSGGANLPVRTPNHYTGVVWIIFYTKWDLIGLFLYHCLLLVSLLTWSLIRFDQQHVPLKSYLTTFVLALVPPLIWPELQLVVLNSGKSATLGITLLTAGIGLLIGFVLGLLTIKTLGKGSSTTSVSEKYEFIGGIALTGVVLGWQAVCSVLVITLLFRRLQLSLAKSKSDDLLKLPLTGCLLLATVFQLTSWRIQASYMNHFWPVSGLSLAPVLVWASLTLFLLLILRNEIRTCSNELPEPEKSASLHHKQEVMNWTH